MCDDGEKKSNNYLLLSSFVYRNGDLIDVTDPDSYEGGTTRDPALLVKNVTREDLGTYSCVVQNEIGTEESDVKAHINVLCK
ncbi:HEPACAM family member 2 [Orchesella cincta]|uniref:HEPACAM family member 2 n=1 Tax=Orchesella cincta TaxID=48709 RepID=A0A1D2N4L5_ORCCI|nr:HEPACAM family member 2 [Orchesella cincta]